MDVPTPSPDDDDYARVLSIKKDAAVNIVNASLKADENCFRMRHNDVLDKLYAEILEKKPLLIQQAGAGLTIDVVPGQSQPGA